MTRMPQNYCANNEISKLSQGLFFRVLCDSEALKVNNFFSLTSTKMYKFKSVIAAL